MTIIGLEAATAALDGACIGPAEIHAALGFDPLAALEGAEHAAVATVPFAGDTLAAARAAGALLVLRVPRDPGGPLSMLRLAERLGGGFDPRVHTGVGYMLRDEWTIDAQRFASTEVCTAGWYLVHPRPLGATFNRGYREQDDALAALGGARAGVPPRRSAVEIAWDTLLWHRTHNQRLLADVWDWSRSESADRGFVALGEFGDRGLGVVAYSRAVRFGSLGVCPQR